MSASSTKSILSKGRGRDPTVIGCPSIIAVMSTELLPAFEDSLTELEVASSRTTSENFGETLNDVLVEPVVGAPLPFESVRLPDSIRTNPTPDELHAAETGVTALGAGIADYGSVIVQSRPGGDEPISLYPPLHVGVLRASDLVPDMPAAISWLEDEFDAGRDTAVLTSGPSATGDMGELVRRVHGPLDVHVITLTDL